ncbi:MAG: hypothetical protein DME59_08535 [Verrucomicrobia bacterium]|nr:MAG: hypothetical protein DME59_08535 [Verrucomicrobiota bacterium]PYL77963.1 MAG: hypothetical protein DMF26_02280 [Verrucomicrobiota bacterium]
MAATRLERRVCIRLRAPFETWCKRGRRAGRRVFVDGNQWFGVAAGVVGDCSHYRKLHQLAVRASLHPAQHCLSALARGRYSCSAGVLDFSRRTDFHIALVRDRPGNFRLGFGGKADRKNGGTPVTFLAFLFIMISLVTFVAAQLILKRAMEFSTTNGMRNSYFTSRVAIGVFLMTVSFFLTLGLLQRFDLSYLYPFQGLSVIFITILAAVVLKEKLSARLTIGALLITAGIVLVSMS